MDERGKLQIAAEIWAELNDQEFLRCEGDAFRFRSADGHEWSTPLTLDRAVGALLDRENPWKASRAAAASLVRLGPDVLVDPDELASVNWTGGRTPGINYRLKGQDGTFYAPATREEWESAAEALGYMVFKAADIARAYTSKEKPLFPAAPQPEPEVSRLFTIAGRALTADEFKRLAEDPYGFWADEYRRMPTPQPEPEAVVIARDWAASVGVEFLGMTIGRGPLRDGATFRFREADGREFGSALSDSALMVRDADKLRACFAAARHVAASRTETDPQPEPTIRILLEGGRYRNETRRVPANSDQYRILNAGMGERCIYRPTGRTVVSAGETLAVWQCEGSEPVPQPEPEPPSWRDRKPLL